MGTAQSSGEMSEIFLITGHLPLHLNIKEPGLISFFLLFEYIFDVFIFTHIVHIYEERNTYYCPSFFLQ